MEDLEEGSDIESCRSSVISDIDELEASLYGIIHHEVNKEADENFSHALSVLPVSECEGFWRTEDNVPDVTEKDVNNGKNSECRVANVKGSSEEEKKYQLHEGGGQDEEKEEEQGCVSQNRSKSSVQDHLIEYADSRYNVGCASDNSKEGNSTKSSNIPTSNSEPTPPQKKSSSPIVIDVLSSDEEPEMCVENTVSQPDKQFIEDIVVLDDTDSDVMIEMERVKVREKKRKKFAEVSDDIQLNTVNYGKVGRFDAVISPHAHESVDIQSDSPASNIFSTPMKELDLSTICQTWTPEMINFYEESWGGENWSLNEVMASMSDHGWRVDVTDQFSTLPGTTRDRRYFGQSTAWCCNCNRRGHTRNECPQKQRKPKCRRCGSENHSEYNCDEKICLSCGKETKYFLSACRSCRSYLDKGTRCTICSVKGHVSKICPDLWRRYHATIVPGQIVRPKNVLYKSSMNLYCCNCATKGHHVFQCKKKTLSSYVPPYPKVIKYDDPSSPSRDTGRQTISANWEERRKSDLTRNREVTPRSSKKDSEKRDLRLDNFKEEHESRSENPIENGISITSSTDELGRPPIVFNDSTPVVSTKIEPSNPKKKNLNNKTTKPPKLQNADLNISTETNAKQPTLKIKTNLFTNNNQIQPVNNCVDQTPVKRSSNMILSKKQYEMLNGKQGEEVLKYVSRTVPGTAVTLLHTDVKMVVFIGNRKSVTQARNLMTTLLRDIGAMNRVTELSALNQVSGKKKNKKQKSKAKVNGLPVQAQDLREKICNKISAASKSLLGLATPGPDHSKGPKNNKTKTKNAKRKNVKVEQIMGPDDPGAKSSIQMTIRNLLRSSEGVTPARVRSFSNWAIRNYGKFINKTVRETLGTLSCVKENHVTTEYLRKNLMSILKWKNS